MNKDDYNIHYVVS